MVGLPLQVVKTRAASKEQPGGVAHSNGVVLLVPGIILGTLCVLELLILTTIPGTGTVTTTPLAHFTGEETDTQERQSNLSSN